MPRGALIYGTIGLFFVAAVVMRVTHAMSEEWTGTQMGIALGALLGRLSHQGAGTPGPGAEGKP